MGMTATQRAERQAEALEYRRAGYSVEDIRVRLRFATTAQTETAIAREIARTMVIPGAMTAAYEKTIKALSLGVVDTAAVALGRRLVQEIDTATAFGDSTRLTKALYLVPHLTTMLRELGATPAARAALPLPEPPAEPKVPASPAVNDLDQFRHDHGIG